jgi:flavin-dependent dehydrogenase
MVGCDMELAKETLSVREGENMDTIREEAREIPIAADCDICVVGGSCTGVFAAVSAARLSAKVAIIENNGFFGGVATASLVNIWHSIYDTTGQRQIIAGLTVETIERLKKRHAVFISQPTESRHYVLNTEELKIELDELIMEADVQPFLHTRFVFPILKDGELVAIAIEDKSGRRAVKASYFIDATGDADLIARMGLPFYKNEHLQPPTMCAIIRGLAEIRKRHPEFSLNRAAFEPHQPKFPDLEMTLW